MADEQGADDAVPADRHNDELDQPVDLQAGRKPTRDERIAAIYGKVASGGHGSSLVTGRASTEGDDSGATVELDGDDGDDVPLTDARKRAKKGRVDATLAIAQAEAEQRREMRGKIVYPVLKGAAAQIVIADILFAVYGFANGWDIGTPAITAWLSATVVQVVGVVLVVMRYLFPSATVQTEAGEDRTESQS